MKVIGFVAAGIVALILAWMGGSAMTERGVKEPSYTVEHRTHDYEIRTYAPYVVAEAHVPEGSKDPLNEGFRMLFAYIGGANRSKRQIPMSTPVLRHEPSPEKIPMSKPVLRRYEAEGTRVAFVLLDEVAPETAPEPEDPRIHLRAVAARRMAVLRFSGYASEARMAEKTAELLTSLARDGLKAVGAPEQAYYNPPWTPPFMRRNEILVEVETPRQTP